MFVLLLVVVGVLVFVVAAVAAGAGSSMAAAHPDRPGPHLPAERLLSRADVDRVRFSVGLRGYRMDEVDDVFDRLAVELADRDVRIGELERALSVGRDTPGAAGPVSAEAGPASAEAGPVEGVERAAPDGQSPRPERPDR